MESLFSTKFDFMPAEPLYKLGEIILPFKYLANYIIFAGKFLKTYRCLKLKVIFSTTLNRMI